jgi:hypothetical protein
MRSCNLVGNFHIQLLRKGNECLVKVMCVLTFFHLLVTLSLKFVFFVFGYLVYLTLRNIIFCRILRDRALYKVTSDFVDAAISGATGVISRCIPPINPTDPECFHMLV